MKATSLLKQDTGHMKVLGFNSCSAIITHGDNWSYDEAEASLLELQLQRVHGRVCREHGCRAKLGGGLRKVDLEGQVGGVHFDGQVPSCDSDQSKIFAGL